MKYVKIKSIVMMPKPTKAMKKFFISRTNEHIKKVRGVIKLINKLDVNVNKEILSRRGILHDKSKFGY